MFDLLVLLHAAQENGSPWVVPVFLGSFILVLLIIFIRSSQVLAFYYNRIKYGTDITRGKYKYLDRILSQYVPYYRRLTIRGKARFLNRLLIFIDGKGFLGHEGLKITTDNELPRGRAVEVSNGVCDANGLVSNLEGRGIKP